MAKTKKEARRQRLELTIALRKAINEKADTKTIQALQELIEQEKYKQRFTIDYLLDSLPKNYTNTPELRVDVVSDKEKERINKEIGDYFRALSRKYPERYKRRLNERGDDIDGVKVEFYNEKEEYLGWALIRQANTSPVIIMRMEAIGRNNDKILSWIEKQMLKQFSGRREVNLATDDYLRSRLIEFLGQAFKENNAEDFEWIMPLIIPCLGGKNQI